MHIDEYKLEDGTYESPDGVSFEDAESYLCELLGFCGCGSPEEALRFVKDALESFEGSKVSLNSTEEFDRDCKERDERQKAFFDEIEKQRPGITLFVKYFLDNKGLTGHGTSVNWSWLTPKGQMFLEDLRELCGEEQPNDPTET